MLLVLFIQIFILIPNISLSGKNYYVWFSLKTIILFQELSSTFITPENLEAAIDHALANPTDYNFAIDLKGNKYLGRDTQITKPKEAASSASATA